MPNVRFILKEPQNNISKADQIETLIYLIFRYNNNRLKVSTGLKVKPEYWNDRDQLFRSTSRFPQFADNNAVLGKYKNAVEGAYSKCIVNDEVPTNSKLKVELEKRLNHIKTNEYSLNEYIDKFIKTIIEGIRLTDKKNVYATGTIKNFRGFREQFHLYQESKRRRLNFDDINLDFYDDFVLFFNKKDYSPNTIGRHIKNLKTIMRAAREEGLHKNLDIEGKRFKVLREDTKQIYCTEMELDRLYNLDLTAKPHLDKARDIFLVGCYTAQRFSDYSKINNGNVRELGNGIFVIELTQRKTGERVTIPTHWKLKNILNKYNYQLPIIQEQKLNYYIKDIGKLAKIIELIESVEIKGGMKIKSSKPKYEMIKTHTARRSGCTNMYLAGIAPIDIMKLSGHKTEREFLKYINVTKEETAKSLSTHPYFNDILLKKA